MTTAERILIYGVGIRTRGSAWGIRAVLNFGFPPVWILEYRFSDQRLLN